MLTILVGGKAAKCETLNWEPLSLEELAGIASTTGLFGETGRYVLENVLYSERGDEMLDLAEVFVTSPHTFYFEEEKLLKAETERLSKVGAKVEQKQKTEKKAFVFDQFGVATALEKKDKKKLWVGLMRSFAEGEKAEAVGGLLCWKARQMKDVALSRQLVRLYHDSHRGAGDLEILLERFALRL